MLTISIDPGSSATKVGYQADGGPVKFFTVSPHCAKVDPDYAAKKALDDCLPHIENAWVSDLDGCYLIGASAMKYYASEVRNGDRKFSKALYKVLACIAHVQQLEQSMGPVRVGVLLPFDEYANKEQLAKDLKLATANFEFCGHPQQVEIEKISIRPEGAGIFLSGLPQKWDINRARIGVLVIGHRNASWLVAENGKLMTQECFTNDLGFRWLVQEVRQMTGYKEEIGLAKMIFSGKNVPADIDEALQACLPNYWRQIETFLDERPRTDYVVCGGGAALLLRSEVTRKLPGKVSWAYDLARSVVSSGVRDQVLARRLTDCYGLLLSLSASDGGNKNHA